MNKPSFYLFSLSGGKDSTAALLRLIEEKRPIDMILFIDTGLEFPALYRHLKKLEKYIDREITVISAEHSFEYFMLNAEIKRKSSSPVIEKLGYNPNGNSWPGPRQRWCTSRLKDQPRERFLAKLREQYTVYSYVGIAADEEYRLKRQRNKDPFHIHPLVEWGMTEADCLQYCYDRGFDWEGLYKIFHRVSCWCCPLQSLDELRKLHEHFSGLWEQLKCWDDMTWRKFRADYSVHELEVRFALEKEFLKAGKSIQNKAFFDTLKERLVSVNADTGKSV